MFSGPQSVVLFIELSDSRLMIEYYTLHLNLGLQKKSAQPAKDNPFGKLANFNSQLLFNKMKLAEKMLIN